MPEICVLPVHLVNRIAAGEVIERPASIVKELVENALDAGASTIDITVEDGGRRLISIRDDGKGMDADDLALALRPHATSKIAEADDLFNIRTMGFRGEALASISAVAHVRIVSRRRSSGTGACLPVGKVSPVQPDNGYEIRAEGEEISPVRPAAVAAHGTTITVRNLFFNTPARRKFMRTANTEFGHIVGQLTRLSLPNCNVAFSLTHNGRETHRLPAGQTLRQRAADLLGAELAETLVEIGSDEGSVKISGLIAPPHQSRSSARWQYIFVNGRYVRDRVLSHALREAYRGMMEPSRSPAAILFIEVDPSEIDVNVHPTKIEVRFRNGQLLHSQLLGVLREALNKMNVATPAVIGAPAPPEGQTEDNSRQESLRQSLADFFKSAKPAVSLGVERTEQENIGPDHRKRYQTTGRPDGPGQYTPSDFPTAPPQPPESAPQARLIRRNAIQIHNAYIVAATDDGLVIIDQHALHERIIFEEIKRRLLNGRLTSQRLLIPETVEVDQSGKAVLSERADLLERLGVDLTEFGPGSVAVHAVPSLLVERNVSAVAFVRDLLDLLTEHASADPAELLDSVLATMACKAAVKAGDRLTDEEISALLAGRTEADRHGSCPHGRPFALTLTLAELEKQFKRT